MNLIVACDKNYGIGKDGKLLCSLPSELKYFKEKTTGKVVVMGRSTLDSLPGGKALPNRTNIVITRRSDFNKENVKVVHDMDELLLELNNYPTNDIFVIGGASVYNELMDLCDTLYITKIDKTFEADCFIKNVDKLENFKLYRETETMKENGIEFKFTEYKRIR